MVADRYRIHAQQATVEVAVRSEEIVRAQNRSSLANSAPEMANGAASHPISVHKATKGGEEVFLD